MAVNSGEECQNVHSIVVVLPNGGATDSKYELVPNVCQVEVPEAIKNEICLISELNLSHHIIPKMNKAKNYEHCSLDVDIEDGTEIPISSAKPMAHLKSDHSLMRGLQRETFLWFGGKLMQFLVNHHPEFPKIISEGRVMVERIYDAPSNRSRKYKRSPSFNSRMVVFLFSVMSSIGTIILIYLTLRVRLVC